MDFNAILESSPEWEHIFCTHIISKLDLEDQLNARFVCKLWDKMIWRHGAYVNLDMNLVRRSEYVEGIIGPDRYPLVHNVEPLAVVSPSVTETEMEELVEAMSRLTLDDSAEKRKGKMKAACYEHYDCYPVPYLPMMRNFEEGQSSRSRDVKPL